MLKKLLSDPSFTKRSPFNADLSTTLITPHFVRGEYPSPPISDAPRQILRGVDRRLMIVAGPCSLHDRKLALEYAVRFKELADSVADKVLLVMRCFIEKPRSRLGWKGLMYDPSLKGQSSLNEGLLESRRLLCEIAEMGLPLASEFLEPFSAHYTADLISLGFIGARTSASQIHRELASALPCPVGFKNSIDGDISVAVHGVLAASFSHSFMTINEKAEAVIATSSGNPDCFVVLRGSSTRSNYQKESLKAACNLLQEEGLQSPLMIDCSHGNSGKDFRKQLDVFKEVLQQRASFPIAGLMLESHLLPGNELSLTDSCLGFTETEELVFLATEQVTKP